VTGVIAKNGEDKFLKFMANKGVLIACGDFSRNHEMVVDLIDELVDVQREQIDKFRGIGRNGDGQKLGIWAGGRMEPGPRAIMGGLPQVVPVHLVPLLFSASTILESASPMRPVGPLATRPYDSQKGRSARSGTPTGAKNSSISRRITAMWTPVMPRKWPVRRRR
jgi:hypothetical protein